MVSLQNGQRINILLMICTDPTPLVFVFDLQPADMDTEVIDKSDV